MPISEILGGALVQGGANLLGNILGFGSQSSANKTNLRIAQMNNEFNERMLQKQMDYNTEMWMKENEYNSASSQVARLRAAGLNPALMMGSGNAGVASSANGVNPHAAQPVTMQAYHPDFGGVGQAVQTYLNATMQQQSIDNETRVKQAQADQLNIENKYLAATKVAELGRIIADTDDKRTRAMLQDIDASLRSQMNEADLTQKVMQNRYLEQQTKQAAIQTLISQKELAVFDERIRLQFANMSADTFVKFAAGKLSQKQAAHEIQKLYLTCAQMQGLKISNEVARKSADYLVDKAKYDSRNQGLFGTLNNLIHWFNDKSY